MEPIAAPRQGKTELSLSPFNWPVARKTYIVTVPAAPVVSVAALGATIPAAESAKVPISAKDTTYGYDMVVGDVQTRCLSGDASLTCDVSRLKLEQGSQYDIKMIRHFKEFSEIIGEHQVRVLDPVKVVQSSVRNDQVVYDKPANYTLQVSKPIISAKAILERTDGPASNSVVAVDVSGDQVVMTPDAELAREANYKLTLTDAKGTDGSTLAEPYSINFRLAGGPKVTGVNIGSSGVDVTQTIIIQFDQPAKAAQDAATYIRVKDNDGATVALKGDKAYIQLKNASACSAFTLVVSRGLVNDSNIATVSDWRFTSRVRCSTVSVIGYSVQSRPIYAYSFGSGANTVLFTGAIHGSELSAKYSMDDWVGYLEMHAPELPGDRRVVVIPAVNPDGVAVKTRNNAHNVNLNRNFATADWAADTALAGGGVEVGAGGSAPSSEPETAALTSFTVNLQPRFVINYHSQGSLVNSNDIGAAAAIGQKYASLTGYQFVPSTNTEEALGYAVTGTYEDWLAARGTPAILIELPGHTGRYFSTNVDAMWMVAQGS